MPKTFLRSEFKNGRAAWFLFAATPFSVLLSFPLPSLFLPVLTAIAIFPVFFYYTRKGMLGLAFWYMAVWAVMLTLVVAGLTAMDPAVMTAQIYGMPMMLPALETSVQSGGDLWALTANLAKERYADFAMGCGLSMISGGILALALGAVVICEIGFTAGSVIYAGYGPGAAILAIDPWQITSIMGIGMASAGFACIFYALVDKSPIKWAASFRWIVLGAAFVALDIYFYIYLGPTWKAALAEVMKI